MKRIISLFIASMILVIPAFAQATNLSPVATVNLTRTEGITVGQLRTEVNNLQSQAGRALTAAERRQVLDSMINNILMLQDAERSRITVSDNELNAQIQDLRNQVAQSIGRQPTDTEFATVIRSNYSMEMPAFREQLRKTLTIQKYLLTKKPELNNPRIPTEAEILNTYNLTRTQYIRPDTVRISMIQVSFTDAATRTSARTVADRLVSQIGNSPERFDEAVLRGQTAGAGYEAGDAGYLPRNLEGQQLVGAEFMTVAFSLRQGEVSRLIEGPRGFHIIKITETYSQRNLELDDIFQLGTSYTVKDYIGNALLQQYQQELLERVTTELVTELRRGNPYRIDENVWNSITW